MTIRSRLTIGVVDDDEAVRTALVRLLSVTGYRVMAIASSTEVLTAVASREVELLILDINLGDTTGLALARQLGAAGYKLPIVFMTASDDQRLRKECLDFGATAFLLKPFSNSELCEAIEMLLSGLFASRKAHCRTDTETS